MKCFSLHFSLYFAALCFLFPLRAKGVSSKEKKNKILSANTDGQGPSKICFNLMLKNLIFHLKEGVEPLPEVLEGSVAAEAPPPVENAAGNFNFCFYQ